MEIRPETHADHDAITAILIEAFADQPYSHQTEHLIVDELRRVGALTVSLVAEVDGQVVGHVAFSRVTIDEVDCKWFTLGPVAVARRIQRRGIGRRLIEAGLDALRGLGAQGCVLVGDPAYYSRSGFRADPALTLEGVPPENLMTLSLTGHHPQGRVLLNPAFWIE